MDYEEISTEEKLRIISGFLLDSPPGEVTDVLNDIRALVGEDEAIEEGIADTLKKYNTEQLVTVKLSGQSESAIICEAASLGDNRYLDPSSKKTFEFDHVRQAISEIEDIEAEDTEDELYRQVISDAIVQYVADRYPQGTSAVFKKEDEVTIVIVDNKYNPSNFWNGRWRSVWTWTRNSNVFKGKITTNIHYYEDGNVQMASSKSIEDSVAGTSVSTIPKIAASQIVKLVTHAEDEYQRGLNTTYTQLSGCTFKNLRRTLPITRKRLEWDKIANYKIGAELTKK
ncbi:F-actin-capping protein subunit alpha [Syncephalis fuscata]|nr:F-actin-capping protein subunit alpha [Syncephalis fuscata]